MLSNSSPAALNNQAFSDPANAHRTDESKLSSTRQATLSPAQWIYPAAVVFAIFLILIGF